MVQQLYKFSQAWPSGTHQHAVLTHGNSRGNSVISVSQNELAVSHATVTAKLRRVVGFFSAPFCPRSCKLKRDHEHETRTAPSSCKAVLKLSRFEG